MNDIFGSLSSNTLSANGNQTFTADSITEGVATGLVFIKLFRGGRFNYRLVYSGVIDSTFADGQISVCNDACDWTIERVSVAVTEKCEPDDYRFVDLSFGGKKSVYIGNKDYVISDAVELTAEKDNYLCVRIEFSGKVVPCHKESIIPVYRFINGRYELCPEVPVPVFTGIEYTPEKKIAFLGDSITQGIGSTFNSYNNYTAVASELIGQKYSFWNLGLGFGRASDMESKGIWLDKAKKNDVAVVCCGVNDILREQNAEKLKNDLHTIVSELKSSGASVLIQTVPPFDYSNEHTKIWLDVNDYIRTELSKIADGFFDNVPILSKSDENNPRAAYGGHPNDEGGIIWGRALAPEIIKLL